MQFVSTFIFLAPLVFAIYESPPTVVTPLGDTELIRETLTQLQLTNLAPDACTACKSRLAIGKVLALTRPDLVPYVFKRWCTESMNDGGQCELNFSPFSADKSSTGTDFIMMLQSMSPEGLDGDYFCYYHETKCVVKPATPEINLETMWPPRPKSYEAPVQSGESFNVVHLGNINLQPDYTVTAEANCSQSLCCVPHSTNYDAAPKGYSIHVSDTKSGTASFFNCTYGRGNYERGNYIDIYNRDAWCPAHSFGTYLCDTPPVLLNSTLRSIRTFHENLLDFEFAIVTGSAIDHRDRQYLGKNDHIAAQRQAYSAVNSHLHSIPVYPSFGDTYPRDQLAPSNHQLFAGQQWQFDFQADTIAKLAWCDTTEANLVRYRHYGYSVVTNRGLKIVSLSSKVWDLKNLYNFFGTQNPDKYGAWNFLVNELVESESNNQRVWIIAEHPNSVNSMPVASKVFLKIVRRFSPKVIAAIFFGSDDETHQVVYDADCNETPDTAVAFALMAPSVSPYAGSNPGWRYYTVDEDTFDIINSFTFFTPLNDSYANSGAEPVWRFGYSAREFLDPSGSWPVEEPLTPRFWHSVSERLLNNTQTTTSLQEIRRRWSPYRESICGSSDGYGDNLHCLTTSFSIDQKLLCMCFDEQGDYFEPKSAAINRDLPAYLPTAVLNQTLASRRALSLKKHGKKWTLE